MLSVFLTYLRCALTHGKSTSILRPFTTLVSRNGNFLYVPCNFGSLITGCLVRRMKLLGYTTGSILYFLDTAIHLLFNPLFFSKQDVFSA
jgi:hypothetical protein